MDVFVAGAAERFGRRLVPQLVAKGHRVVATTRSPAKLAQLRAMGAEAVAMDGLDPIAVGKVLGRVQRPRSSYTR